jgi:hypothetical protein
MSGKCSSSHASTREIDFAHQASFARASLAPTKLVNPIQIFDEQR